MKPRISIITPSFNQGKYIEETIVSVLNQNYNNLEYLIFDGGSTDNTLEILKNYDNLITYWESKPDKGTWDANNKGLDMLTGDYWCILNSDDILLPNALEKISNFVLTNNNYSWITGGTHLINKNSEVKQKIIPKPIVPINNFTFANRNWIYHPSTFISKDIIDKIGFFNNTDMMDFDYWIRMELAGYKPHIFKSHLAGLRFHYECKTVNQTDSLKKEYKLINSYKHQFLINANKKNRHQFVKHIKNKQVNYLIYSIKYNFFHKNYSQTFYKIISLTIAFPNSIFKRWYWGLIKRLLQKRIEEEDFNQFMHLI